MMTGMLERLGFTNIVKRDNAKYDVELDGRKFLGLQVVLDKFTQVNHVPTTVNFQFMFDYWEDADKQKHQGRSF